MSQALRDTIRDRQADLLRTLVHQRPAPKGFDEAMFRESASSLANKRRHAVKATCPKLAAQLGERFHSLFSEFAKSNGIPAFGGPVADGRAFARYVATIEPLSVEAKLEALAIDLKFEAYAQGLFPRQGFFIGIVKLDPPKHYAIAVRIPWIGERWWFI